MNSVSTSDNPQKIKRIDFNCSTHDIIPNGIFTKEQLKKNMEKLNKKKEDKKKKVVIKKEPSNAIS